MSNRPVNCVFRRHGFTLIEIVIVVLILGIMAAVAVPSYQAWVNRSRVQNASNRLLADLMHASTLARTTGRPVNVNFDFDQDSYTIQTAPGADNPESFGTFRLAEYPFHVDLVRGNARIEFDRYGDALTNGSWILKSNDSNIAEILIELGHSTGSRTR